MLNNYIFLSVLKHLQLNISKGGCRVDAFTPYLPVPSKTGCRGRGPLLSEIDFPLFYFNFYNFHTQSSLGLLNL